MNSPATSPAVAALTAALLSTASIAQDDAISPTFRDLADLVRVRVVCSNQHFGRLQDLLVALPTGRVAAAVVAMTTDTGDAVVTVPFGELRYDAWGNVLRLQPCLDEGHEYPPFDPDRVEAGGEADALTGAVLASRLAGAVLELTGDDAGSIHGMCLELTSGHVAFLDAATGAEQPGDRPGDRDLHPVPWAALQVRAVADESTGPVRVGLQRSAQALAAMPSLVEVIVQDPIYRRPLYGLYGVPRPEYDRDGS